MNQRLALVCAAVVLTAGCTQQVDGAALPVLSQAPGGVVRVDGVLLGPAQMRAVTGSLDLAVSPGMNGKAPIDDPELATAVPSACQFVFADSSTFGPDTEDFRKTSYRIAAGNERISEAAAAYHGAKAAGEAFARLRTAVIGCADTHYGRVLVGEWKADTSSVRMRLASCGRDYRLKSSVVVEVTFCGFPDATTGAVMANIVSRILT
jgi:hypothetical protein